MRCLQLVKPKYLHLLLLLQPSVIMWPLNVGYDVQISKKVPELHVATEREGHLHAFCCTKAGSRWVARFAADTIFNQTRCARL
jgi:hypothetical protein